MENMDATSQMLLILLVGAIVFMFILIVVYVILKIKDNSTSKQKEESIVDEKSTKTVKEKDDKQSVFNFMDFDSIEDNMIIQQNGKRFIMVIECQGVNYDLMSAVEKTGVEEGFVQFLNTLRHPIQIYVQTQTVNLENSLAGYKSKVKEIETNLFRLRQQYNSMLETDMYSKEETDKVFYEITKLTNLYEYGKDIINDTEKMSLNKNILNKKYYIVISYHASELGKNDLDKSEIQAMAFSELYTRAQTIIRAISSCSVNSRILNSIELAELLYVAYNRDESEVFELKQAIRAEYDRLYSTAPDVLEKKMRALDKEIEDRAVMKVTEKVEKFKSKYREKVEEKENILDQLADEMADLILQENRDYLGQDVVDGILQEEKNKKGGTEDEEKQVKKRKRTTRASTTKQ